MDFHFGKSATMTGTFTLEVFPEALGGKSIEQVSALSSKLFAKNQEKESFDLIF